MKNRVERKKKGKKIKIKGRDKQGGREWPSITQSTISKVFCPMATQAFIYTDSLILGHHFMEFTFYLTIAQCFCILHVSQSHNQRKLYSEILDWSMFEVGTLMISIFHLNSQPIEESHKYPYRPDIFSYCSSLTLTKKKNPKPPTKQKKVLKRIS